MLAESHVLVVIGDWCPGCHIMLRSYQERRAALADKGVKLIAISRDDAPIQRDLARELKLEYELLSDDDGAVAAKFGVVLESGYPTSPYDGPLPIPSAFLIDTCGIIRHATGPNEFIIRRKAHKPQARRWCHTDVRDNPRQRSNR